MFLANTGPTFVKYLLSIFAIVGMSPIILPLLLNCTGYLHSRQDFPMISCKIFQVPHMLPRLSEINLL